MITIEDYVFMSFIIKDKYTLIDMNNYLWFYHGKHENLKDLEKKLEKLIKRNLISVVKIGKTKHYEVIGVGHEILNDYKYYYARVIFNFFKNPKKYSRR